jgi:hypothetical protein
MYRADTSEAIDPLWGGCKCISNLPPYCQMLVNSNSIHAQALLSSNSVNGTCLDHCRQNLAFALVGPFRKPL